MQANNVAARPTFWVGRFHVVALHPRRHRLNRISHFLAPALGVEAYCAAPAITCRASSTAGLFEPAVNELKVATDSWYALLSCVA
jgi:hypothetical protein